MKDEREIIDHLTKTLELLKTGGPESSQQQGTAVTGGDHAEGAQSSQKNPDDDLLKYSHSYIDFTYDNPTIYHLVSSLSKQLEAAGFDYLSEKVDWTDKVYRGGKYFTIRNGTNLTAFHIGGSWVPSNGVAAIGAHADSLTAKLKPLSKKPSVEGYELLGVAQYGGTLNDLWFDRDLGIAGRVLYKGVEGWSVESKLINSAPHPIARIPTLAPHFGQPAVPPFDKESQAVPVIGYSQEEELAATEEEKKSPLFGKHSLQLLRYVASLAGVQVSQLLQLDLELFDVQKGTIGGIKNDFLFAPRIDDRICSYASLIALIEYSNKVNLEYDDTFAVVSLFDNEEVGSFSRQGAVGGSLKTAVERATLPVYKRIDPVILDGKSLDFHALWANSIILSADVNHLFNPNFTEVYLENHRPKPNVGVTLSLDTNQHMVTDVVGVTFVEELARINGDRVQYFHIKNNSRSGGTIGPYIASQTGARTIDLGIPQLSMHSIRATTGSKDVGLGVKFFRGFFQNWRKVLNGFGDL